MAEPEDIDRGNWGYRRNDIKDFADPSRIYLTRWRLRFGPRFGIFLHRINLPDADRHCHDHPWPWLGIVLRGGYDEVVPHPKIPNDPSMNQTRVWKVGSIHRMGLDDRHQIARLHRSPTWTLLFVGKRKQTWGFFLEDGTKVPWKEYIANR